MINDDVDLVWRGPFASLPRPMDAGMVRDVATVASLFAGIAALAILPYLFGWVEIEGAHRTALVGVFIATVASSLAQFVLRSASPQRMEVLHPTVATTLFVLGSVLMAAAVVYAGPSLGSIAVFYVEFMLLAFLLLRVKWAIVITVLHLATYAVALALLNDPPAPVQQFINVLASAVVAGGLIGGMARRLDVTRRSLAELNHNLEDRVSAQVDELERTNRLRRFLSAQVADVVTSEGTEAMLSPHRADIAAFFVDLRGFTAFTNSVSAERVMLVLSQYYAAVGSVLDAHGATIGGFDGDGVFVYLGDPVPRDDAAAAAVDMAKDIARGMDGLTATWSDDAVTVGYGIGLSYGEATLGLVGFENRADYTPIGAVVNMAARLCADARHGEIVVDDALCTAARLGGAATPRRDVDLKGFGLTATYALAR